MVKSFIEKRVLFPKRGQRDFINKAAELLSIEDMAKVCNLSERTIRDWRREKFLMDFLSLKKICDKLHIPLPQKIKLADKYWYAAKGASAGGKATWKKYGRIGNDADYRKKKWLEWWKREGKNKCAIIVPKKFNKPKLSEDLAEFIGIVLGDGGITKWQITITLHYKDDKQYGNSVIKLIKRLFNVPVGIYRKDSTSNLMISRSELINFCEKELGLKRGNKVKHQVDIPDWIKANKNYLIACVRGLMDTDGCVFVHKYGVNGKKYCYKKLSFTNHSKPLIKSVFECFQMLDMNPRVTKDGWDVRLENKADVQRYFTIVKPHNPKYLKRYKK